MSFQAMAIVAEIKIRDPLAKCLLTAMANYADENCKCFPSQERLADDTGMSIRSVRRKTDWLVRAGFLSVDHERRGRSTINLYKIHPATQSASNTVHPARVSASKPFTRPHSPIHPATVAAEPVIEPVDDKMIGAGGRDEYLELENKLRSAAGVTNENCALGLADLSPIIGLVNGGADLETEILPAIRARPNPGVRSWKYFTGQIQQYRANLKSAASEPIPAARAGPSFARPRHGGKSIQQIAAEMLAECENEQTGSGSGNSGNLIRLPVSRKY